MPQCIAQASARPHRKEEAGQTDPREGEGIREGERIGDRPN